ncbi:MAG: TIM barrel protein [Desulfosarcinaceae bacterium]
MTVLKFSINTGMLFTERPFLDRFEACRSAGFEYLEFPFPYAFDPRVLNDSIQKSGLELILFDLPIDDWDSGGRGCATDPQAVEAFRDGLEKAVRYASILQPKFLTCIVGKKIKGLSYGQQKAVLIDNLRHACGLLAPMGIDLLVEVFNDYDHPDFFLTSVDAAAALVAEVDRPNLKIQFDTYHVQLMEGDLSRSIKRHINAIGHIQIGDVPGRHQPGTGDINFPGLFKDLEGLAYSGYIGLEYIPLGETGDSLGWMKKGRLAAFGFRD